MLTGVPPFYDGDSDTFRCNIISGSLHLEHSPGTYITLQPRDPTISLVYESWPLCSIPQCLALQRGKGSLRMNAIKPIGRKTQVPPIN